MRTVLSYVASQPSPAPKVSKRKATLQSATPAGQTCGGAFAGCVVELALRWARRSDNHGESDDEACARRRPCYPANAPPQAQPEGVGSPKSKQPNSQTAKQPNSHTGHCFARRTPRGRKRHALRKLGRAKQWPEGMSGLGFPSGCAEERSGQRIRARDCLSATQWSEFERDPAGREHRRLPAAKRRDAACRVAFSWLTFFWRGKRE